MKSWWQKLSDSKVATWQAFLFSAAASIAVGPELVFSLNPGDSQTGRIAFVCGQVVVGLFFVFARVTFLRNKRVGEAPWLSFGTLLFVSLANVLTIRLVAEFLLKVELTSNFLPLAIEGVVAFFIWQTCLAVIVSETGRYRREAGALKAEIFMGKELERHAVEHLEKLRQKVAAEITTSINKTFNSAVQATTAPRTSKLLRSLIDEVVKPLSQKLEGREPEFSELQLSRSTATISKKVLLGQLIRALAERAPFDIRFTPLVVAILSNFTRHWSTNQAPPVALFILCWADLTALMAVGILLQKTLKPRISPRKWIWVALSLHLIAALVDATLTQLVFGALNPQQVGGLFFANLFALSLTAYSRGLMLERRATMKKFENASKELDWMNARLAQLIWVENRRLAMMVHGDIQSRIMATALSLELQQPTQPEIRKALALLLENCERALLDPIQAGTLGDFIDSLALLWSGSVLIENKIPAQLMLAIEADEIMVDAISELIRETVTNAVKHGQATRLWVTGSLSAEIEGQGQGHQILHLSIRDNGLESASPLQVSPGQGTRLFDQISLDWNLGRTADGATLEIRIPMRNVD